MGAKHLPQAPYVINFKNSRQSFLAMGSLQQPIKHTYNATFLRVSLICKLSKFAWRLLLFRPKRRLHAPLQLYEVQYFEV